jgi:hypothetical protein
MPCVCVGLDPVSWGRYQREASTVFDRHHLAGPGQEALKTRRFFRQRDCRTGVDVALWWLNASWYGPIIPDIPGREM